MTKFWTLKKETETEVKVLPRTREEYQPKLETHALKLTQLKS